MIPLQLPQQPTLRNLGVVGSGGSSINDLRIVECILEVDSINNPDLKPPL